MKSLILLLLLTTTLTSQSSLETISHAIKYGYTLNLVNDTILLKSKQKVRFVYILGRENKTNIRYQEKKRKIIKIYVVGLES